MNHKSVNDKLRKALQNPGAAFGALRPMLAARWQLRGCTRVGAWARVTGRVLVYNDGCLTLGEKVRLRGTQVPVELACMAGGTLEIGDGVFINSGTSICAENCVRIGRNVAIGNYSLIMDTDFHATNDHTQAAEARPVIIEDDVWLGARVTVLKGVRIGRGAVVGAGAVVTKDVPPRTVVGGVPARIIRSLDAMPTLTEASA